MSLRSVICVAACVVAAVLGLGLWLYFVEFADPSPPIGGAGLMVQVKLPPIHSEAAAKGMVLFRNKCATCHGENAAGSENGPPLVHRIYEPGHHGDVAFYLAARNGVRAHHWQFGDMPPQPDVSDTEMAAIVAYVRELQQANGIF